MPCPLGLTGVNILLVLAAVLDRDPDDAAVGNVARVGDRQSVLLVTVANQALACRMREKERCYSTIYFSGPKCEPLEK